MNQNRKSPLKTFVVPGLAASGMLALSSCESIAVARKGNTPDVGR